MIQPDNLDDATLEYAAQLIEQPSFLDISGVIAKRKRDREDAALRLRVREEFRKETAKHLRAMKGRRDLDSAAVLRRVSERSDTSRHGISLVDAWPLAWKGWLDIHATVKCTSNQMPPETYYNVTLTERGRKILDDYEEEKLGRCDG